MPTIAIVDGVRIFMYPRDHLPPHLHAKFAEFEAQISILTGDVLEGRLPAGKLRVIRAGLQLGRSHSRGRSCGRGVRWE